MMTRFKQILLILGLLLAAGLIGFALWYVYHKVAAPKAPPGVRPAGPGAQLPPSAERVAAPAAPAAPAPAALPTAALLPPVTPPIYRPALVEKITSQAAVFPSLGTDGAMRFHNASDGKFYRVGADGNVRALTDQIFYNVKNVTWAGNKDKAVIEYPDGTKTIYNFDQKKQITLPSHWTDFTFSPDSSQLAAKSLALAPENRWLVTTNDDGTNTKLVEPLGDNADKVTMDWSPSRQTVAFSQTGQPQGADRREVLFIGLNNENFKSTIVEGLDFQPQWSTTGKKLLYSVDSARSDFKPELWVVDSYGDAIGSNRQALQINTWANKCSFAGDDTLYCAVPRTLPEGAGMAPAIANDTPDDLYKIDLKTGLKAPIPTGGDYTVNSISYDSTANKIMFTDAHQNGIFQVKL